MKIRISLAFRIGLFCFLNTASFSQGSELFSSPAEKPYMDQLIDFFGQGSLPTQKEITGKFAGRCFSRDSRNQPQNYMLIGQMMENDLAGPLFPQSQSGKFVLFDSTRSDLSAHEFDTYLFFRGKEIEKEMEKKVSSLYLYEMDGSQVFGTSSQFPSYVRKYQNYFIVLSTGGSRDNVLSACYTFQEVN